MVAESVKGEDLRLVSKGDEKFRADCGNVKDKTKPFLRDVFYDICLNGHAEPVGHICINIISRKHLVPECFSLFREAMDDYSHELSCLATDVFTRNGILRRNVFDTLPDWTLPWSVDDSNRLKEQSFVYVAALVIEADWRRRGIGTWATQNVLETDIVRQFGVEYMLAWPTVINHLEPSRGPGNRTDEDIIAYEAKREGIVWFYRKMGFRRLGVTQFFMLAKNPTHPSRLLRPEDDLPHVTLRR